MWQTRERWFSLLSTVLSVSAGFCYTSDSIPYRHSHSPVRSCMGTVIADATTAATRLRILL